MEEIGKNGSEVLQLRLLLKELVAGKMKDGPMLGLGAVVAQVWLSCVKRSGCWLQLHKATYRDAKEARGSSLHAQRVLKVGGSAVSRAGVIIDAQGADRAREGWWNCKGKKNKINKELLTRLGRTEAAE